MAIAQAEISARATTTASNDMNKQALSGEYREISDFQELTAQLLEQC